MSYPLLQTRRANLTVAISGFAISFLGSLPLGTVNVLMVQLAASGGLKAALWFAAGCLLAELGYVWISLAARSIVVKSGVMHKTLKWVSVMILAGLAISSFAAAFYGSPAVGVFLPGEFSPFIFGFLLMVINPVQAPFWFGWSTVLFERKVLMPAPTSHVLYMIGVGLGSIAGSLVFILAGRSLVTWFPGWQSALHLVIGGVYVVTAIWLFWKNRVNFSCGSR